MNAIHCTYLGCFLKGVTLRTPAEVGRVEVPPVSQAPYVQGGKFLGEGEVGENWGWEVEVGRGEGKREDGSVSSRTLSKRGNMGPGI